MMADEGKHKPWGGRFTEATDEFVEIFTASVSFDKRLALFDIDGSLAHATMLESIGVLTSAELEAIRTGLVEIRDEINEDRFSWSIALEDVHMNIEATLTEKIGETGKKLHTGRSRNDQVATDIRLYLRAAIDEIADRMTRLQAGLLDLAAREADTIMPGFTHLQVAQPVTFGHHLMAWHEMIDRDYDRLMDCRKRVNVLPLGAAALAGTSYPVDRELTAELLGFEAAAANSLDAVSDRDFAIEFTAVASLAMVHLSRWAEELVLWTSPQYEFIELPDRFCTGSSIMPQKKNPDVPELVRGKSGRVFGDLIGLLTLMKGQPLAYNKDNQEDKEPLFDAADTLHDCLTAFADLIPAITPRRDRMYDATLRGYATATDLADYLVQQGLPFRDAHEVVGQLVGEAIGQDCGLADLDMDTLRSASDMIGDDVYQILTPEGSVNARDHAGGTSPARVRDAIANARARLGARDSAL